ncbi:hypothetical protein HY491_02830 [Candidatus Woesearchaeota archaeon]|nr:hypothetical protein [Candidatus Woesearchaeota archaeon]
MVNHYPIIFAFSSSGHVLDAGYAASPGRIDLDIKFFIGKILKIMMVNWGDVATGHKPERKQECSLIKVHRGIAKLNFAGLAAAFGKSQPLAYLVFRVITAIAFAAPFIIMAKCIAFCFAGAEITEPIINNPRRHSFTYLPLVIILVNLQ